jgi:hypothetical protein
MFVDSLTKLHTALPVSIRNIYLPAIHAFQSIRMFFPKLKILEGEEISTALPMRVAYFGLDDRILSYWTELLFAQKPSIRTTSRVPIWKVKEFIGKSEEKFDLAIVELTGITKKVIALKSGFLLPRWLDLEIDVHKPIHIKQLDTIKRRIRKYKLTFERRYTDSDLQYFYKRMYLPYISARHKDASVITDYNNFHYSFSRKKSQLFFILKDGEPIAGAIDILEGKNGIRMGSMGVLDGREDLLREGVIGACYYFRILDYQNRKINSVNLGGTSPILTEGLTQYKLSFGGEARDRKHLSSPYIMLLPVNNTAAVRKALKSNPFIYIDDINTYRGIFCNPEAADEKMDFLNIFNLTNCGNIKETIVYCFNGVSDISDWLDKELREKVRFVSYNTGDNITY